MRLFLLHVSPQNFKDVNDTRLPKTQFTGIPYRFPDQSIPGEGSVAVGGAGLSIQVSKSLHGAAAFSIRASELKV